jgi:DNA polymerase-3 subunit delta'
MIYICSDLEFAQNKIIEKIESNLVRKFYEDEFKIEHSKGVIKEAYISESEPKYIVISAISFNIYAQNALLKLLEEPPKNIVFILITKNKSSLLPTIRSRMPLEVINIEKNSIDLGLELRKYGLKEIFEFLKNHSYDSKDRIKELVEAIIIGALKDLKINFTQYELDMFDRLLYLIDLNSRPQNILAYLLMLIYRKRDESSTVR